METNTAPQDSQDDDSDALETPDNVISAVNPAKQAELDAVKPAKKTLKQKLAKFNLYLLLFVFILFVAGAITVITYFQSKKADNTAVISTQTLDQKSLDQIASSDTTVGDPKQLLSVQSNAVFAGKVLVRDTLEVAGGIQVTGPVTLSGLTVTGKANLDETQVSRNLAVAGDTAVQGALTVARSLQVNGGGTFSGPVSVPQLTVTNLQINADLVLTNHITAGGPSPSRTVGPALGSGGTASVNGSDTAGTIGINTGNGPPAGCFINVNFAKRYDGVPRVIISPVGADAGGLSHYVTRTTAGFSVCVASAPPSGASFAFDYFVVN